MPRHSRSRSRTRPRKPVVPDPKQRSITNFFSPSPTPQKPPSPMHLTPPPDQNADTNRPQKPLTQEELLITSTLQSLDCTRSAPSSPNPSSPPKSISPAKRPPPNSPTASPSKRTCPTPEKLASPSTPSDDRTPPGLRPPTPPSDTAPDGDSSSDDSYADLRRRPRRSGRVSRDVVRFDPGQVVSGGGRGESVFSGGGFDERGNWGDVALRNLVREREMRRREEMEIEKMRVVEEGVRVSEQEERLVGMARQVEEGEKCKLERLEKYSAGVPLFVEEVCMKVMPSRYTTRGRRGDGLPRHCLDDTFINLFKHGAAGEFAIGTLIAPVVRRMCAKGGTGDLFAVADVIFHLVVYDGTADEAGQVSREGLVKSLEVMMRGNGLRKCASITTQCRLPDLVSVLRCYGAVFDDVKRPHVWGRSQTGERSLDAAVLAGGEDGREEDAVLMRKMLRNLKRVFVISAVRVRGKEKLYSALNGAIRGMKRGEGVFNAFAICVRVLCSPFGCRLAPEVGLLVAALLERVDGKDWAGVRFGLAKVVFVVTRRLGVHVEMVTWLLPYHTLRARGLMFDVGFLSLVQWCGGPGGNPVARDVGEVEVSEEARKFGVEMMSFCVGDVVELLKGMPEWVAETDVEWAHGVARVLKQTLADRAVLKRRGKGDLEGLVSWVRKMRFTSHRLVFEVAVPQINIALDGLLGAVEEICGRKEDLQEVNPRVKVEKKQCTLEG